MINWTLKLIADDASMETVTLGTQYLNLLHTIVGSTSNLLSYGQHTSTQEVVMDTTSEPSTECNEYVIVGDNLDKNFQPSHQREDGQTQ